MPKTPGLIKGLGVTFGTLVETVTKGANTVQYPHEKETPPIRARGVIALQSGDDGRVLSITPPLAIERGILELALDLLAEAAA